MSKKINWHEMTFPPINLWNVPIVENKEKIVGTGETKDYVTISKSEYESLLEDSLWLSALEGAGVDNWQGYDFAREIFEEMQEE